MDVALRMYPLKYALHVHMPTELKITPLGANRLPLACRSEAQMKSAVSLNTTLLFILLTNDRNEFNNLLCACNSLLYPSLLFFFFPFLLWRSQVDVVVLWNPVQHSHFRL